MKFRHDKAELKAPIVKGGTVTYQGVVARTHAPGDGLVYDGGKRIEYRDLSGLKEIARQLVGKSVVVSHPSKGSGRLREDSSKVIVGVISAAEVVGNEAVATIKITHSDGLSAVKTGIQELSVGYGATTDATGYQRQFEVDHLAIVEYARCGNACKLRADACQCSNHMQDSFRNQDYQGNPHTMDPTQVEALRSLESQRAEAEARAVAAETAVTAETLRADMAEGKCSVQEAEISDLKLKIAAGSTAVESEAIVREKLRADAAEALVANFDNTYETRVRARVALERKAAVVLGDDFRCDSFDDRQIMSTVVKKLDASAEIGSNVSDGVIHGQFLALTARHASSARSLARVAEAAATQPHADAKEAANKKRLENWRKPLPNGTK